MPCPTVPRDLQGNEPDLTSQEPQLPPLSTSDEGIRTRPLPGVRCPTCAANGEEVWVIPGRACGKCGTPCC